MVAEEQEVPSFKMGQTDETVITAWQVITEQEAIHLAQVPRMDMSLPTDSQELTARMAGVAAAAAAVAVARAIVTVMAAPEEAAAAALKQEMEENPVMEAEDHLGFGVIVPV